MKEVQGKLLPCLVAEIFHVSRATHYSVLVLRTVVRENVCSSSFSSFLAMNNDGFRSKFGLGFVTR